VNTTADIGVVLDGHNIVLAAPTQPPMKLLVTDFLKKARRSGAALRPVDGRLELQGEGDLQAEFQRHRPVLEMLAGAERLGGIAAETAAATAAILSGYGVRARLLTTIPEATNSVYQLLEAAGDRGVIGADIETTPLAPFTVPRPPLNITADGAISSKQPAWNNDAGLDPYRAEVRVLSLWNPRAGDARVIDLRHVPLAALPPELWKARFVFHNATFDVKHLLHAGAALQPNKLLCSMLIAGLIARGEPFKSLEGKRRPSLAVAAKELINVNVPKQGQMADWDVPSLDPAHVDYAALDAVLAYQVLKVCVAKIGSSEHRALDIACGCIHAAARLELAGLPFDAEIHRATAKTWEEPQCRNEG
jgi:hypothetical protein